MEEFIEKPGSGGLNGAQSRNRTNDTGIFSPLLYQLSYLGVKGRVPLTILLVIKRIEVFVQPVVKNFLKFLYY